MTTTSNKPEVFTVALGGKVTGKVNIIINGKDSAYVTCTELHGAPGSAVVLRRKEYRASAHFKINPNTGEFNGLIEDNRRVQYVDKEAIVWDKKRCSHIYETYSSNGGVRHEVSEPAARDIWDSLYEALNIFYKNNPDKMHNEFVRVANADLLSKYEVAKNKVERLNGELEQARKEEDELYLECKNKGLIHPKGWFKVDII